MKRVNEKSSHWYDSTESVIETYYYCNHCERILLMPFCPDCGKNRLPKVCSLCLSRDGANVPRDKNKYCDRCMTVPVPSKDIIEKDGILYWKGSPFYVLGRFNRMTDHDVLAGYVDLRVTQLEKEVTELKGIVNDLLQLIRAFK